jgi:hypothetical protein
MAGGIGLSLIPTNIPGSLSIFSCFFGLASLHLYASYRALSSVSLDTLNYQRTRIIVDHFLKNGSILSPVMVSKLERFVLFTRIFASPKIVLGKSLSEAMASNKDLTDSLELFASKKFLLSIKNDQVFVFIYQDSQFADILEGFFCACYLRAHPHLNLKEAVNDPQSDMNQKFQAFLAQLNQSEWDLDLLHLETGEWRFKYVNSTK